MHIPTRIRTQPYLHTYARTYTQTCAHEDRDTDTNANASTEEHTKRLFRSAEIVGIKIPYSQSQINEAKDELIKKMNLKTNILKTVEVHRNLKTYYLVLNDTWYNNNISNIIVSCD